MNSWSYRYLDTFQNNIISIILLITVLLQNGNVNYQNDVAGVELSKLGLAQAEQHCTVNISVENKVNLIS